MSVVSGAGYMPGQTPSQHALQRTDTPDVSLHTLPYNYDSNGTDTTAITMRDRLAHLLLQLLHIISHHPFHLLLSLHFFPGGSTLLRRSSHNPTTSSSTPDLTLVRSRSNTTGSTNAGGTTYVQPRSTRGRFVNG